MVLKILGVLRKKKDGVEEGGVVFFKNNSLVDSHSVCNA